ncbi:MAG: CoA pyrophosphatase [Proteobacteria bacterium]|nr:CoA pyrophosphatase [Pseudomonadota bacterium]
MKKSTNPKQSDVADITRLKQCIKKNSHPTSLGSFKPACVFLLLYEKNGALHIPAILKADNIGYPWANQVALPGGLIEKSDNSPVDTAYRELEEELGITRPHVEHIGSMGHFQTLKNTEIEVFTGIWDEQETICFDPSEIAKIVDVPIDKLLDTHFSRGLAGRAPGWEELMYPIDDVVIWGATAKILHYFLELVY